jgi:hypothetical protein
MNSFSEFSATRRQRGGGEIAQLPQFVAHPVYKNLSSGPIVHLHSGEPRGQNAGTAL